MVTQPGTEVEVQQILRELNELAMEHKRLMGRHRRAGRELRQQAEQIKVKLGQLGIRVVP